VKSNGARRDVILIGGSAGGVRLLRELFGRLDSRLQHASIFVTVHRPPSPHSELASVLGRRAALPVREPRDGESIARGVIYLAPPDHHMRLDGHRIRLDRGPKEHHTRPAIDPLFVSAMESAGSRAIGVLLTGNLSDGVAGLIAIKRGGGLSLVQDPKEAEWPQMPRNAVLYDHVDVVFSSAALPALLAELVHGASPKRGNGAHAIGSRAT
jgi:two-component system, chemotaxis family, protein-glutamate methylesterase/glutaminase